MVKIRITEIPAGEAPENIRKQWVGLILPVDVFLDFKTGIQEGVLGGPPKLENLNGFPVKIEDAINALEEAKKQEAVLWWKNNISFFGRGASHLVFGKNVCELLSVN